MNCFKLIPAKNHNPSKPDIMFISLALSLSDKRIYITKYIFETLNILSKDFNVYVMLTNQGTSTIKQIKSMYGDNLNFVGFNGKIEYKTKTFYKQNNLDPNNMEKDNREKTLSIVNHDLSFIKNLKAVFLDPPVVFGEYYHDSVDKDPIKLEKYLKTIDSMNEGIQHGKVIRYNAFMLRNSRMFFDIIENYIKTHGTKVYQFLIDTSTYYPYFNKIHGAKTYYFNDDFRGTRYFHEFPIGQLNYLLGNNCVPSTDDFLKKEKSFIWGGVVMNADGERMKDYLRFLDKLRLKESKLHISKSNSVLPSTSPNYDKKLQGHEHFQQTLDSINNHPLNVGVVLAEEFEKSLKDYKYTLILKCLAQHDALNFRIYYSLINNIIPFIADNYDPDNLQIPQNLYDKLIVRNHSDIMNKVEYFEKNQSEAISLLNELKSYFLNDNYFDYNYYYEQFRSNYFKELY